METALIQRNNKKLNDRCIVREISEMEKAFIQRI